MALYRLLKIILERITELFELFRITNKFLTFGETRKTQVPRVKEGYEHLKKSGTSKETIQMRV